MKDQKQLIIDDLLERINGSPFMLVAEYTGCTVTDFGELRNRLRATGSECHVVKNSYVKRAAKAAELPAELNDLLSGQTAVVTGEQDICAAAKVLKNFAAEFDKAAVKVGVLDGKLLTSDDVKALASLPSREVLLGQLLGVLQAPATKLARLLSEPAASLARVMKAREEQGGSGAGAVAGAVAEEAAPAEETKEAEPRGEEKVEAAPEAEAAAAGEAEAVEEAPPAEAEASPEEAPPAAEGTAEAGEEGSGAAGGEEKAES